MRHGKIHLGTGGTGFQPVVSGILPETWGALHAHCLTNTCALLAREKSGRMPDLTGWKPVPPDTYTRYSSFVIRH
jgi:hypothetical protein